MGRFRERIDKRGFTRYKDSDPYEDHRLETDGSFTHSNFNFDDQEFGRERRLGRFTGRNRYGEERIRHDSYQDDQYRNDYDPTYEDEYGMRHPYEHGGRLNRWSDDLRSESSHEDHFGKGPKGYRRADKNIREEACEILTRSPELDATEIEVEVKEGVIHLRGEVIDRHDKRLAEELVEYISGAKDVQNQLRIKHQVDGWIPGIGHAHNDELGQ